jgi:hypothetical protein
MVVSHETISTPVMLVDFFIDHTFNLNMPIPLYGLDTCADCNVGAIN